MDIFVVESVGIDDRDQIDIELFADQEGATERSVALEKITTGVEIRTGAVGLQGNYKEFQINQDTNPNDIDEFVWDEINRYGKSNFKLILIPLEE